MRDDVQKLIAIIEARSNRAEKDMARFAAVAERRISQVERTNARAARQAEAAWRRSHDAMERQNARVAASMRANFQSVGRIARTALAGLGVREILGMADAWTSAENRLKAVGVSQGDVAGRMDELLAVANRSRSAIGETVRLYSRLTLASQELGLSQKEVARITETAQKAFTVSGATTNEAASAALQLSQAMGAGVLQGQELMSLRENAPRLAMAIAAEFGTTVGKLKQLGEEGALVSDRVAKAILRASTDIDASFASTQMTVAQAGVVFANSMGAYIASVDDAVGASKAIVAILDAVARNADLLAGAIITLSTILIGRFAARAIGAAITGLVAFTGQMRVAAAWSVALGTRASATGAVMAGLGSGLLRAFGGPVGALITAVGVGLAYFATTADDAAVSAADVAAGTERINDALAMAEEAYSAAATETERANRANRDLIGALMGVDTATDAANESTKLRTTFLREQAIAAWRAAQAEAFLRAEAGKQELAAMRKRHGELLPALWQDPNREGIGTMERVEIERGRAEVDSIIQRTPLLEAQVKLDEDSAKRLWNAIADAESGKITPLPDGGEGAGGTGTGVKAETFQKRALELQGQRAQAAEKYRVTLEEIAAAKEKGIKSATGEALDFAALRQGALEEYNDTLATIGDREGKAGSKAAKDAAKASKDSIKDQAAAQGDLDRMLKESTGALLERRDALTELAVSDFERGKPFDDADFERARLAAEALKLELREIAEVRAAAAAQGIDGSAVSGDAEIAAAVAYAEQVGSITLAVQGLRAAAAGDPANAAAFERGAAALENFDANAAVAGEVIERFGDKTAEARGEFEKLARLVSRGAFDADAGGAQAAMDAQIDALLRMAGASGTAAEALALLYSMRPPSGADAQAWAESQIAAAMRIRQAAAGSEVTRIDPKGAGEQRENDLYLRSRAAFMSAARDGINALSEGDFEGFLTSLKTGLQDIVAEAMFRPIENWLSQVFDQMWNSGFGEITGGLDAAGADWSNAAAKSATAVAEQTAKTAALTVEQITATASLAGLTAAANAAALALASVGGSGGGGIGDILGSLFSGGSGSPGISSGVSAGISGLGFSDGGYTGPGPTNEPAGIVHKGEVVWSKADVREAGGVRSAEAMRADPERGAQAAIASPYSDAAEQPLAEARQREIASFERRQDAYSDGGYTGPGAKHEPAGVVHRGEYVFDKAATARIGVDNLERMRRGALPGYAMGGPVGIPAMPSIPRIPTARPASMTTSVSAVFAPVINIQGGAGPNEVRAIRRELEVAEARFDAKLRVRDQTERARVTGIVNDGNQRRTIRKGRGQ